MHVFRNLVLTKEKASLFFIITVRLDMFDENLRIEIRQLAVTILDLFRSSLLLRLILDGLSEPKVHLLCADCD